MGEVFVPHSTNIEPYFQPKALRNDKNHPLGRYAKLVITYPDQPRDIDTGRDSFKRSASDFLRRVLELLGLAKDTSSKRKMRELGRRFDDTFGSFVYAAHVERIDYSAVESLRRQFNSLKKPATSDTVFKDLVLAHFRENLKALSPEDRENFISNIVKFDVEKAHNALMERQFEFTKRLYEAFGEDAISSDQIKQENEQNLALFQQLQNAAFTLGFDCNIDPSTLSEEALQALHKELNSEETRTDLALLEATISKSSPPLKEKAQLQLEKLKNLQVNASRIVKNKIIEDLQCQLKAFIGDLDKGPTIEVDGGILPTADIVAGRYSTLRGAVFRILNEHSFVEKDARNKTLTFQNGFVKLALANLPFEDRARLLSILPGDELCQLNNVDYFLPLTAEERDILSELNLQISNETAARIKQFTNTAEEFLASPLEDQLDLKKFAEVSKSCYGMTGLALDDSTKELLQRLNDFVTSKESLSLDEYSDDNLLLLKQALSNIAPESNLLQRIEEEVTQRLKLADQEYFASLKPLLEAISSHEINALTLLTNISTILEEIEVRLIDRHAALGDLQTDSGFITNIRNALLTQYFSEKFDAQHLAELDKYAHENGLIYLLHLLSELAPSAKSPTSFDIALKTKASAMAKLIGDIGNALAIAQNRAEEENWTKPINLAAEFDTIPNNIKTAFSEYFKLDFTPAENKRTLRFTPKTEQS